jgi:polar amino acid transport system substrate-binding protein
MNKFFKSALVVMLVALLVFSVGCAKKEAPADAEKVLIVGTEPTFPPFEMTDEKTGDIIGFDIDLIKKIAESQGFKVEIQSIGFDGLIPALQSGQIDIIASGMTITEDRAKEVQFSEPYINAGLALAVLESNTEIASVEDLEGLTVGVQIGTTGSEKAAELLEQGLIKEVKTFNTVDIVMMELVNGGIDAVINDLPVTTAYISKQPGTIKMVGEPLSSESYGFAVRLDDKDLAAKINAGLAELTESGYYDELTQEYF